MRDYLFLRPREPSDEDLDERELRRRRRELFLASSHSLALSDHLLPMALLVAVVALVAGLRSSAPALGVFLASVLHHDLARTELRVVLRFDRLVSILLFVELLPVSLCSSSVKNVKCIQRIQSSSLWSLP